jgi:hypothetical protein
MKLPDGWTIETANRAVFRGGERYDITSCGKKIGDGWPFVITVEREGDNFTVQTDDDDLSYTVGSYTTATIPVAVFKTLLDL